MIDIAKQKFDSEKHKNIIFEHSSIFDIRSKKEEFNAILSFNILHLLEDAPKVMQRINELLKPGGLFISSTPSMAKNTTFSGIFYFLLGKTGIVPHLKFSKFKVLDDLVTNGGFQIIETENINGTPPNYFIVAKKI